MSLRNYGLIGSCTELAELVARLHDSDAPIGLDVETGYAGPDREKFALHPETAFLVGISLTNSLDWARYIPLAHDVGDNLDNREVARLLWPLLATGRAVAHNMPFELRHLSTWFRRHLWDDPTYGCQVRDSHGYFPARSCTQVEAYLVADYQRFGIKYLVEQIFHHKMTELHELFPGLPVNRRKMLRFNPLPLEPHVIEYACEDALWCLALHQRNYPAVKDTLLYRVEMAILPIICEMEDYGVQYDWAAMGRAAEAMRTFRDKFGAEIMADLSELTGTPTIINLASPAKVANVLYEQLGYRTTVYTGTTRNLPAGQRRMSTGKIALESLSKKYPVVKKITQWKEMTRLVGTYLERYEKLYSYADDGRSHPNHMSAVVVTGRFAVADPPYQGSPKKYHFDLEPAKAVHAAHGEAHGKCSCAEFTSPAGTCFQLNFRDFIAAPPEHYMLGFDLSQAELRAVAGLAKEDALLHAFASGEDVHRVTTALMLKVPLTEVTPELRNVGKMVNFALLYGMGVKSLADRLAVSKEEAQVLYDQYFDAYPGIAAWAARQVQQGKRDGYVTSHFNRKLPIWEYQSDKEWIRQKGDRACVNYPVQGAATGDAVKIIMVRCHTALKDAGLLDRVHLVMNVHDALEFYVHQSVLPQTVVSILQPAVIFPITGWPTMVADWHLGKRWGSLLAIEITEDGRFLVKGDQIQELSPDVEEDEETGEDTMVVDPDDDVNPEAIQLALDTIRSAADREGSPTKRVVVTVTDMPDEVSYQRFLTFLTDRVGPNTLTLRTPEGDLPLDLTDGTDLGPWDVAAVSMILGPVSITYHQDDVNGADLVAGLRL